MTLHNRMEPMDPAPLRPGCCDWCGARVPPLRSYCNPTCRTRYRNLLTAQGKVVMQLLKHWRMHRGAKGTPGEGKITAVAARVDEMLGHDRARLAALKLERDGMTMSETVISGAQAIKLGARTCKELK